MTTLYITEFALSGRDGRGSLVPAAHQPAVAQQTVNIGASSAASAALASNTALVRLHVDGACHIAFGTDPTAATTSARMAADQTEYFSVPIGSALKVAVIEAA